MDGDVVIRDEPSAAFTRSIARHLKCAAFKGFDGAAQNIVGFALEFGSGSWRCFVDGRTRGVEAVGARLAGGIFGDELDIGAGKRRSTAADRGTSVAA